MTQSIKRLLNKHEDVSLDPHVNVRGHGNLPIILVCKRQRQRIPRASQLPKAAESMSSVFT